MSDLWGIYDLMWNAFVSRTISHSGEYIGVIVHDPSKAEVEKWLDLYGRFNGRGCEVRAIPPELANRMADCICPVHRAVNFPGRHGVTPARNKLAGDFNEAEKPLRVGVGALLIRADGHVLAASRRGIPSDLGLPGGKVDPGETEAQALVRELQEETGITATRYHRLFAAPDGHGFWFVTFLVYEWSGEWGGPSGLSFEKEKGVTVQWVSPENLLQTSCSFRSYNRDLFAHLGLIQHELV